MLAMLALLAQMQKIDTLDMHGVLKIAVVNALRDAEHRNATTGRFDQATHIYIDVAGFRRAAGLGTDVPQSWTDVASLAGTRGAIKRKEDLWQCDPKVDRSACRPLAPGVILVHVDSIVRDQTGIHFNVGVNWGLRGGARGADGGVVYTATFERAGGGYVFESLRTALVM